MNKMWLVYHTGPDGMLINFHVARNEGEARDVCSGWCADREDGNVVMVSKDLFKLTKIVHETTPDGWVFSGQQSQRTEHAGYIGLKSVVTARPPSPISEVRELAPLPSPPPQATNWTPELIAELKRKIEQPREEWFAKCKQD